jgi:hypothetical protein
VVRGGRSPSRQSAARMQNPPPGAGDACSARVRLARHPNLRRSVGFVREKLSQGGRRRSARGGRARNARGDGGALSRTLRRHRRGRRAPPIHAAAELHGAVVDSSDRVPSAQARRERAARAHARDGGAAVGKAEEREEQRGEERAARGKRGGREQRAVPRASSVHAQALRPGRCAGLSLGLMVLRERLEGVGGGRGGRRGAEGCAPCPKAQGLDRGPGRRTRPG